MVVHVVPYKTVFWLFWAFLHLAGGTLVAVETYFMHVFMVFWDANKDRAKRFFLRPTVSEIFRHFLDPIPVYIDIWSPIGPNSQNAI